MFAWNIETPGDYHLIVYFYSNSKYAKLEAAAMIFMASKKQKCTKYESLQLQEIKHTHT